MEKRRTVAMDPAQALELYKLTAAEFDVRLRLHNETLTRHLQFTAALLTATFVGIPALERLGVSPQWLLIGPIINVLICYLCIRTLDRHYRGCLERTTVIAKLQELLKLRVSRTEPGADPDIVAAIDAVFWEDEYLIPLRWVKGSEGFSSDEAFVQHYLQQGVNQRAKQTFGVLILLNILLGLLIAIGVTP
jgi:hypothetical protein